MKRKRESYWKKSKIGVGIKYEWKGKIKKEKKYNRKETECRKNKVLKNENKK